MKFLLLDISCQGPESDECFMVDGPLQPSTDKYLSMARPVEETEEFLVGNPVINWD